MNNLERKPKYAMRKLSVGLVSCMLGFALMAGPSHSFASGGAEGEETEVKQVLEEEQSEENSLEISDVKIDGPVGQEEKNIYKYNFAWKTYEDNKKGLYDETHKGDPIKLKLRLTYADPNDRRNRKYVYSDDIDFVIGENKSIELDINEYAKKTGIDNAVFREAALVADEKTNNYKFISSTKTPDGSKEFDYVISQNMDTKLKEKKEEDAIILEEDKKNININYKIQEYEKDGENEDGTPKFAEEPTDKTVRRRGKDIPLVHERKFEDGKEIKLAWEDGTIGGSINRNSELDLFSLLGKDRKYGIVGEFKDEKHKKYYTLKIEGSDLEGWTVTLGSKLRKKTEFENIQEQEYKIIRIEDPNLDFGEEVVDREGENGKTADVYETIYLPGEGGEDEVVVPKKLVEKNRRIKEIVNKIIRIGTKRKTPDTPIIPDNPDTEIPDDQEDLTPEERDELDKLIQDLLDEINKEEETPDTKPEDTKKPTDNEEEKPNENEEVKPSENEETKKPEKEEGKKDTANPVKTKPAAQKANKNASPKTGVTGSATIAALGLSSLFASLGLKKKND